MYNGKEDDLQEVFKIHLQEPGTKINMSEHDGLLPRAKKLTPDCSLCLLTTLVVNAYCY